MRLVKVLFFALFFFHPFTMVHAEKLKKANDVGDTATSNIQIQFDHYPEAFNPGLVKSEWGYILSFRTLPDPKQLWISGLGVVLLNENLEPISEPQLISTRDQNRMTDQQSEDARLFVHNGKVFLTYNDNMEITDPKSNQHRDIYIAELLYKDGIFSVAQPVMIYHEHKYETQMWQKNWTPFTWNNKLMMTYTVNPHEVIQPDLETGNCSVVESTRVFSSWQWGPLRGGTPAQLVDGEYLAFFHSANQRKSDVSKRRARWHYYMGAYTFNPEPPFNVTKMSSKPIVAKGFYIESSHQKRVIFPGGFIVDGNKIHVAYGKDDCEVWIVTFDKDKFMQHLYAPKGYDIPLQETMNQILDNN